jgi:hypothetical protein
VSRFFLISMNPSHKESPQIGVSYSRTQNIVTGFSIREEESTHIRAIHNNTTQEKKIRRVQAQVLQETAQNSAQISPESLDSVVAECQSYVLFLECLGAEGDHHMGPYSPKRPHSLCSFLAKEAKNHLHAGGTGSVRCATGPGPRALSPRF